MVWIPIDFKFGFLYPRVSKKVEIIYRSGDYRMRLEYIPEEKAGKVIERDGMVWSAYKWRYMDGIGDWEYVK